MEKVTLKYGEEKRLLGGHLWIFSNEIEKVSGHPAIGETVEVFSNRGVSLGVGFYNPHSLIAFRLLSRENIEIDRKFWVERLQKALLFRKEIFPGMEAFRAVFGESDGLPGLIADKYGKYLSVQFLSAGLEKNKETVTAALKDVFNCEGIIARNDSALRALEGLEERVEMLYGDVPDKAVVDEGLLKFYADLKGGQKTGFYFDQRENRTALSKYCGQKSFLDCFCHTGAFGVQAAKAGAKRVVWVDSSKNAIEIARENAQLNGVGGGFNGVCADVLEYLDSLKAKSEKFDIINIDPPGLIKNKKNFHAGYRVYLKINLLALKSLSPGGILATSSCSHHLGREDFRKMLAEAAAQSGKNIRVLEVRSQARDHPVLASMPETEYLKFAILQEADF